MRVIFSQTFEAREARSELEELLERIAARRRLLTERWRASSSYDRLLSVQRLLDEGSLAPEVREALLPRHEAVRDAWARIRALRLLTQSAEARPVPPRDLPLWRHGVTMAEIDLQRAEAERDRGLSAQGLWDDLFTVSETFLLAEPYTRETVPLREMLAVQAALEERVRDFERPPPGEPQAAGSAVEPKPSAAIRILTPVDDQGACAAE